MGEVSISLGGLLLKGSAVFSWFFVVFSCSRVCLPVVAGDTTVTSTTTSTTTTSIARSTTTTGISTNTIASCASSSIRNATTSATTSTTTSTTILVLSLVLPKMNARPVLHGLLLDLRWTYA